VAEVDLAGFTRALRGARRIGVDTPIWIYHLEDVRPYSDLTLHLFSEAVAGTRELVLSAVSLAEILVGPWRNEDSGRAGRIEDVLKAIPGVSSADLTWTAASMGARIRGQTDLPLPDALIIASALERQAQLIITNDAEWGRVKRLPCRVLILDNYLREQRA